MTGELVALVLVALAFLSGKWFISRLFKGQVTTSWFQLIAYTFCGLGFGIVVGGFIKLALLSAEIPYVVGLITFFTPAVLGAFLGAFIAYKYPSTITVDKSFAEKLEGANRKIDPNLEIKKGVALLVIGGILAVTDYFHGFDSIQSDLSFEGYFLKGAYILALVIGLYTLIVELLKRRKIR